MHGQDTIANETRYWIFGSLMVLAAAGVFVILALKYPLPKELLGPRATIQTGGSQTGYDVLQNFQYRL